MDLHKVLSKGGSFNKYYFHITVIIIFSVFHDLFCKWQTDFGVDVFYIMIV